MEAKHLLAHMIEEDNVVSLSFAKLFNFRVPRVLCFTVSV